MQKDTRKRIWLYSIFAICVSALVFGVILPRRRDLIQSQQTATMLRPLLAADARFSDVEALYSTGGQAILMGTLRSDADLQALKHLVEEAHPPQNPALAIHIISPNPE